MARSLCVALALFAGADAFAPLAPRALRSLSALSSQMPDAEKDLGFEAWKPPG
eukprot:CAMPEP_0172612934 /NCGR_PEP_ID=MMETSP1068-20121228/38875_1 /TAXON_ID=35684 /ORGANISM="Pseudopedinella elastica, Strain CCMP716" /LENGTH=52 /DNA_ID=CAMNT_0013417235 /DNA_START=34 /DNA_END=188 /DNA_ORIENTATION=-